MANITNTKEAIIEFYHRHPYTVRGIEASILALTIKLEYNRIAKEDQIRKKLQKHPIRRRLLFTKLEIPQIMEAVNKWMIQLKKLPLIPQSAISASRINN